MSIGALDVLIIACSKAIVLFLEYYHMKSITNNYKKLSNDYELYNHQDRRFFSLKGHILVWLIFKIKLARHILMFDYLDILK